MLVPMLVPIKVVQILVPILKRVQALLALK
jgi:hypothetical protein